MSAQGLCMDFLDDTADVAIMQRPRRRRQKIKAKSTLFNAGGWSPKPCMLRSLKQTWSQNCLNFATTPSIKKCGFWIDRSPMLTKTLSHLCIRQVA